MPNIINNSTPPRFEAKRVQAFEPSKPDKIPVAVGVALDRFVAVFPCGVSLRRSSRGDFADSPLLTGKAGDSNIFTPSLSRRWGGQGGEEKLQCFSSGCHRRPPMVLIFKMRMGSWGNKTMIRLYISFEMWIPAIRQLHFSISEFGICPTRNPHSTHFSVKVKKLEMFIFMCKIS